MDGKELDSGVSVTTVTKELIAPTVEFKASEKEFLTDLPFNPIDKLPF